MALLPTWRLSLLAIITSFLTQFNFGFLIASVNVPVETFVKFINQSTAAQNQGKHYSYSGIHQLWLCIVVIPYATCILGCLLAAVAGNLLGRRAALMLHANTINIVGCIVSGCAFPSNRWQLLLVGRMISGISIGLANVILPVYLTELAPLRFRGMMGSLHGVFSFIVSIIATAIAMPFALGGNLNWGWLVSFPAWASLIQIILMPLCPESPAFLYIHRREPLAAAIVVRFYHETDNDVHVKEILEGFEDERQEMRNWPGLSKVWNQLRIKRIIRYGVAIGAAHSFTLAHILITSSTYIFIYTLGLPPFQKYIVTWVCIALTFFALPIAPLTVDRVGRRPLFFTGLIITLIGTIIFFIGAIADQYGGHQMWSTWLCAAAAFLISAAYTAGPWSLSWFLTAEYVPEPARVTTVACSHISLWLSALVVGVLFNVLVSQIKAYTYLLLIIFPSVVLLIFLYPRLPETKQKSISQIWNEMDAAEQLATEIKATEDMANHRNQYGTFEDNNEATNNTNL